MEELDYITTKVIEILTTFSLKDRSIVNGTPLGSWDDGSSDLMEFTDGKGPLQSSKNIEALGKALKSLGGLMLSEAIPKNNDLFRYYEEFIGTIDLGELDVDDDNTGLLGSYVRIFTEFKQRRLNHMESTEATQNGTDLVEGEVRESGGSVDTNEESFLYAARGEQSDVSDSPTPSSRTSPQSSPKSSPLAESSVVDVEAVERDSEIATLMTSTTMGNRGALEVQSDASEASKPGKKRQYYSNKPTIKYDNSFNHFTPVDRGEAPTPYVKSPRGAAVESLSTSTESGNNKKEVSHVTDTLQPMTQRWSYQTHASSSGHGKATFKNAGGSNKLYHTQPLLSLTNSLSSTFVEPGAIQLQTVKLPSKPLSTNPKKGSPKLKSTRQVNGHEGSQITDVGEANAGLLSSSHNNEGLIRHGDNTGQDGSSQGGEHKEGGDATLCGINFGNAPSSAPLTPSKETLCQSAVGATGGATTTTTKDDNSATTSSSLEINVSKSPRGVYQSRPMKSSTDRIGLKYIKSNSAVDLHTTVKSSMELGLTFVSVFPHKPSCTGVPFILTATSDGGKAGPKKKLYMTIKSLMEEAVDASRDINDVYKSASKAKVPARVKKLEKHLSDLCKERDQLFSQLTTIQKQLGEKDATYQLIRLVIGVLNTCHDDTSVAVIDQKIKQAFTTPLGLSNRSYHF
jgi:hypothetical protein